MSGKTSFWIRLLAWHKMPFIERLVVVTLAEDLQFETVLGQLNMPSKCITYDEIMTNEGLDGGHHNEQIFQSGDLIIFDEYTRSCDLHPKIDVFIRKLFVRDAHHKNLNIICIMQQILGTPGYKLLHISHSITLQSQQAVNGFVIQRLPLYSEIKRKAQDTFSKLSKVPLFVTLFYNVPPLAQDLSQFIWTPLYQQEAPNGFHAFLSMSKSDKKTDDFIPFVSPSLAAVLEPFMTDNSYVLGHVSAIQHLGAGAKKKNVRLNEGDKRLTSDSLQSKTVEELDKKVDELFRNTVTVKRIGMFKRLWFFVRSQSKFVLDPDTLVLTAAIPSESGTFTKCAMGLHEFFSRLLSPSHLRGGIGKQSGSQHEDTMKAKTTSTKFSLADEKQRQKVASQLLAILLEHDGFNPSLVTNKPLLRQAYKSRAPKLFKEKQSQFLE